MKCKCGTELFEKDIVDYEIKFGYHMCKSERQCDSDGRTYERVWEKYRCPKCFAIKKQNIKRKYWDDINK